MGDYIYRTRECKKKASAIIESRLSSIVLMVITLFACTLPTNSNAMTREFEEETKEALGAPVTELDTLKIDWVQRIESADTRKALQEVFDQLSSLAQELCNRLPNIIKSSGGERLRPTMDALDEVFAILLEFVVGLRNKAAWSTPIMKQCHGLLRRATDCAVYGEVLMLRTARTVEQLRTDFDPKEIAESYARLLQRTKDNDLETFNFNQAREDRFDKVSEKIKYIVKQELEQFNQKMTSAGKRLWVAPVGKAEEKQELSLEAMQIMSAILREIGAIRGQPLEQPWEEARGGIAGAGLPTSDIWFIDPLTVKNFEARLSTKQQRDYYTHLKKTLLAMRWAIMYLRTMDIREESYRYEYAHFVINRYKDMHKKDIEKLQNFIQSSHALINILHAQFTALRPHIIALTTPLGMPSATPLMGPGQSPQSALEILEQATTGMGREFEMRSRETTLGPVSTLEVPRHLVETTIGGYWGTPDQKTQSMMSALNISEDDINGTGEAWRRLYPDISSKQAVLEKIRELKKRNVDEWERSFESIVSEMSDDYPVGKAVLYRDGIRALRHAYIQALMAELPQLKQLVEQYYEQLKNAWDKLVRLYALDRFIEEQGVAAAESARQDLGVMERWIKRLEEEPPKNIRDQRDLYSIIANRSTWFEGKLPSSLLDRVKEPWKSLIERREALFTRFRNVYDALTGARPAFLSALKPGQPVRGAGFPAEPQLAEQQVKPFLSALKPAEPITGGGTGQPLITLQEFYKQTLQLRLKLKDQLFLAENQMPNILKTMNASYREAQLRELKNAFDQIEQDITLLNSKAIIDPSFNPSVLEKSKKEVMAELLLLYTKLRDQYQQLSQLEQQIRHEETDTGSYPKIMNVAEFKEAVNQLIAAFENATKKDIKKLRVALNQLQKVERVDPAFVKRFGKNGVPFATGISLEHLKGILRELEQQGVITGEKIKEIRINDVSKWILNSTMIYNEEAALLNAGLPAFNSVDAISLLTLGPVARNDLDVLQQQMPDNQDLVTLKVNYDEAQKRLSKAVQDKLTQEIRSLLPIASGSKSVVRNPDAIAQILRRINYLFYIAVMVGIDQELLHSLEDRYRMIRTEIAYKRIIPDYNQHLLREDRSWQELPNYKARE